MRQLPVFARSARAIGISIAYTGSRRNLLLGIERLESQMSLGIVGLGTDIIEVVRIGQMIEKHGETFLRRVYTENEIAYCNRRKEYLQHYAGRWAAKEAAMKALGTGWSRGVGWTDLEVAADASGAPVMHIHGGAEEMMGQIGIQRILISISHCRAYATATAVAIGE